MAFFAGLLIAVAYRRPGSRLNTPRNNALPSNKTARAATIFQLLQKIHDNELDVTVFAVEAYGSINFDVGVSKFNENLSRKLVRFLDQRLAELAVQTNPPPTPGGDVSANRVFIVYGHDELAKLQVARFVERLGLSPIILNEQTTQGKTIIECIEHYSDVHYAIVELTGDDVGSSGSRYKAEKQKALRSRARQNVIFELGYFIAKLGRPKVCALLKGDVEVLSDYSGVFYKNMDADGGWEAKVAREMKAAGLSVDLNKL